LTAYRGEDTQAWQDYDASILLSEAIRPIPALVDQGVGEEFMVEQLQPERPEAAAKASGYPLQLRRHDGYDHSYYFIASFIELPLRFHAECFKS
jgi:S-formylglutathione hydrolase